MDYEKKYKDALDAMKMFIYPRLGGDAKLAAEKVFPELRESEDERIRKEIITHLYWAQDRGSLPNDVIQSKRVEDWISWLEKQKEQKELPLMDGNADLYFDEWNQQKQNPTKRQCFEEGMRYAERLQKEQKPAEWSEEDEKMLNDIIGDISWERRNTTVDKDIRHYDSELSWLKSLRPQKREDLPKWKKWNNGACGNSNHIPIALVKVGCSYALTDCLGINGQEYIMLSDLEKLPKEDEK